MAPQQQQTIYRTQNDTQPNIQFSVYRKAPIGSPPNTPLILVDLTPYTGPGNSIALIIESQTSADVTNGGHQTCTVLNPYTAGQVAYVFQVGDLPDEGGDYLCDLILTNAAGPETWYSCLRVKTRPRV